MTTDKSKRKIQHAGMHPECPQCKKQITSHAAEASQLCQNCGYKSDSTDQTHIIEHGTPENAPRNDTGTAAVTVDQSGDLHPEHEEMGPQRNTVQIWPWLMAIVSVVIASGLFTQKEQWLDNRWLRSSAINLGVPLDKRDKDWLIVAKSIQPEWVERTDGSSILIIRGRLKNLLSSKLPPPKLEITFYAATEPNQPLGIQRLHLTMRPDEQAIKHVPFLSPAEDLMPISPLSQREFTLVIESVPDGTGDFTLSAKEM